MILYVFFYYLLVIKENNLKRLTMLYIHANIHLCVLYFVQTLELYFLA